jgi:hypothetical protein
MMEHNIHVKGMNIAPRVLYSHQRREWGITLVMGEDLDFFPVSPVNVIVMISFQSTPRWSWSYSSNVPGRNGQCSYVSK